MKRFFLSLLLASAAALPFSHSAPARAQDSAAADYLVVSLGYFDVFGNDGATDLRLEYRPGNSVMIQNLRPWLGMEATTDGTLWLGGGLLYDWNFAGSWHLVPGIGAGLYTKGGSDKDLDYPVQFRTQIEAAYQYDSGIRAGASLSHISNANLGDHNPGTEVLSLSLGYPF